MGIPEDYGVLVTVLPGGEWHVEWRRDDGQLELSEPVLYWRVYEHGAIPIIITDAVALMLGDGLHCLTLGDGTKVPPCLVRRCCGAGNDGIVRASEAGTLL